MNTALRAFSDAQMEEHWTYCTEVRSEVVECGCDSCTRFKKGIARIARSVGISFTRLKETK